MIFQIVKSNNHVERKGLFHSDSNLACDFHSSNNLSYFYILLQYIYSIMVLWKEQEVGTLEGT